MFYDVYCDRWLVFSELGVHIDGFPAIVGTTVVVSDTETTLTGEKADLVKAVDETAEIVHRCVGARARVCARLDDDVGVVQAVETRHRVG